jgi:hypothetical protein
MADEKRLLVPIDGADHSLRALAHVIKRVASDRQLQIFVLKVQLPLPPSLFVTRSMIADHNKVRLRIAVSDATLAMGDEVSRNNAAAEFRKGPNQRFSIHAT